MTNNTDKLIRWGIIGCGNVTELKSGPAYQKAKHFELTAVMRRNAELAKDYALRHGVEKHYSNAEQLVNDNAIDAVYIATPPDSHKHYALMVAKAGKICCIEKPLSPSYQDSLDITNAFKQAKLPLFVAYYRRSLPRFIKVKQLIDTGKIGKVRHITWTLNKTTKERDKSTEYNWRTDKVVAPGGYFDDLASHGLDLFSYLLGEFKIVHGITDNQQGLYSAYDTVTACWLHNGGITGSGHWNFGSYANKDVVTIIGDKGELIFSIFDEKPIQIITLDEQSELFIENPENVQLYHVQNMQQNLMFGHTHPSTGDSATHTSWVMDKILT